ncbi:hypothetical protein AgCh_010036 [Apium graveolens]
MHRRFDARNNITEEYKHGVQNFINFAMKGKVDSMGRIRCPCNECGNTWRKLPDNVTYDLYRHGIMESYTKWVFHGEKRRSGVEAETSLGNNDPRDDDMYDAREMLQDFADAHGNFGNGEEEPTATEVVEREEGNSQDAPLSVANQRKRDVELLLEVCPPKKGKVKMFPRHTLTELVGIDEVSKYTTSQSSLVCIPERIPKSAYSIIGKVMTDVTNMVEAIEEIVVICAKLDEEVHKLAARAYPNRDNLASKILWEEYIQIASHMTSPLCQRYKKIITESKDVEKPSCNFDSNRVELLNPFTVGGVNLTDKLVKN